MTRLDTLLWVVLPYVAVTVFVVGHIWRYRTDQVGWTTRSSQLLESRRLRAGVLLFHLGFFAVLGGHVLGILVPESVTERAGVTEDMYHVVSVVAGTGSGTLMLVGFVLLMARRGADARLRTVTTRTDKLTYVLLGVMIITGMYATVGENLIAGGYNYRETVAPYFRDVFLLRPDASLVTEAPIVYRLHVIAGLLLYMLWPFSRLVHAWSVPVKYLTRSNILYRRRGGAARAAARSLT